MPSAHARLGPSSAHRWLRCPGSVGMTESVEESDASEYAAEGTVAHHVRETCLAFGMEPEDFIGEVYHEDGFEIVVEPEMAEALRPGIEWVRERPGRLVNELQVRFDRWMPGQFGTLDVGVIDRDLIIINDLKYGAGVPVSAEENEQLMTYALGFWDNVARHETKAKNFLLVIDQPRAEGGGGEWEVHLDDLLQFGERLRTTFDMIFPPEARIGTPEEWPVTPGLTLKAGEKQCQWCKAKGGCAELARFNLDVMQLKFDDLDGDELTLAEAGEFSPARRSRVVQHTPLIKKWLSEVHEHVLADALAGRPTPGFKAVEGRKGDRAWVDEAKAEKKLVKLLGKDRAFNPPKLLSPTQAEALLPKEMHEDLETLWDRAPGKPALADETSDKPALRMADKFDD